MLAKEPHQCGASGVEGDSATNLCPCAGDIMSAHIPCPCAGDILSVHIPC